MKRFSMTKRKLALTSAVLLLLLCALVFSSTIYLQVHAHPYATQPSLGTAASFAVLGGSAVTNTGPTVVNGDLGVGPGSAITGFPPGIVNGTIHAADAVALQAQNDAATAYINAAGQPCDVNETGQDLGGKTLTSGVYCFTSSAQLTGQLTLNGQGNPASVFIFQIGSTLTTASNASVLLTNGAQACNIFWQVGSSATIGTNTHLAGNILALTSITFTTGAVSNGSLYSRNGAVTLDSNTITRAPCAPTPTPTSTPTFTPTPIPTSTPTFTPTPIPTSTPTFTPTPIPTSTPTFTPTPIPTGTPTFTPTPIPTGTPTFTPTPIPTGTPTPIPTGTPTATPTITPTATPIGTPTPTPTGNTPDLFITKTNLGGDHFQVGDKVTYAIVVTNSPTDDPAANPITVTDIIPAGLDNITVNAPNWQVTVSNTSSPAIITATYIGVYPVVPGQVLPSITITGTLNKAAVPSLTDTARVYTLNIVMSPHNTANDTIFVEEQPDRSPTPTGSPTPTPTGNTPDLFITKTNLGGNHFQIGNKVTYVITVTNSPTDDPAANPITVTDVIPTGLDNIAVNAPNWQVTVSTSSSPAVITATYIGVYPVAPGQILPPIMITGTLNNDAVPSLTDTATVDTLNIVKSPHNTAHDTVFVEAQQKKPHCDTNNHTNNSDCHNDNGTGSTGNNFSGSNDNNFNSNTGNSSSGHNDNNNRTITPGMPLTGNDPTGH